MLWDQLAAEYLNNKTCFQVDISVKRFEQLAHLKEWTLSARDGTLHQADLYWRASDLAGAVMKGEFNDFTGKNPLYLLSGVACSREELNLRSGVDVTITASSMNFPFPKEATLSYKFDQYELQEGQIIKVEQQVSDEADKDNVRKRARGW